MARARARSQLAGHWALFTKASSSRIISSNNALLALTKRTHKHKKLKQGKVVIKIAQKTGKKILPSAAGDIFTEEAQFSTNSKARCRWGYALTYGAVLAVSRFYV
jgi:hypothetical protein